MTTDTQVRLNKFAQPCADCKVQIPAGGGSPDVDARHLADVLDSRSSGSSL